MKRTLLDITQKISRKPGKTFLTSKNLEDSTYFIYEAIGWKFVDLLREIELRSEQDRLTVYINSQTIIHTDYIVEIGDRGLLIKFIKANFQYELDSDDIIEIKGDIERYA